ncbi:MAG: RIO1 family regulatory kinase/ATPase [Thermoproteus sp.]
MSIRSLIEAYDVLDRLDLRVLRLLEIAHIRYRYVPYGLLTRWAKADEEKIGYSLSKLNKLKLIQRYRGSYEGYRLTFNAYDILALHTLRKSGKIINISPTPIGVGKESVVYVGEMPSGVKVAVKFHRTGTSSFVHVKKVRSFLGRRRHLTKLYEARLSANAEFTALSKVFDGGGLVPEPIAINRHVVVMRYIEGVEAYRADLHNARFAAKDVLDTIEIALKNGIIHGDLTPYNIIIGDRAYIIDWPQWIPASHPNAAEILLRDLTYLEEFFSRFDVEINKEELLNILYNKKYEKININNIIENTIKSFRGL